MENGLGEKIERQINEQYLSIGKFIVHFEHLVFAIKGKVNLLCGFTPQTSLLLEPYSVRQTLSALNDIIDWKTNDWSPDDPDINTYKLLIKDLENLNLARNLIIHTNWFIGWRNDKTTDLSEFAGSKFSSPFNFKMKKYTASEIDLLTKKAQVFHSIFFTLWSIDPLPPPLPKFSNIWKRNSENEWIDLRKIK